VVIQGEESGCDALIKLLLICDDERLGEGEISQQVLPIEIDFHERGCLRALEKPWDLSVIIDGHQETIMIAVLDH
jgi:hypothetical protein